MHVAIVTDTYVPDVNGAAKTLGHLVREIRAMGHRVSLVRTGVGGSQDEYVIPFFRIPKYPDIKIGMVGAYRLVECWRCSPPDVVYIGMESPMGCQAMRAAEELNIPVIAGFHTNFHHYTRSFKIGFLKAPILKHIRDFHNAAAATVVPTPTVLKELTQLGFERLHVMGRGVDSDSFRPTLRCEELRRAWGATPETPVALYVGRVSPEKNMELFAQSVAAMRVKRPDLVVVVVGDGPSLAKFSLQHPDFHYTKFLHGEDLGRAYASGDLFIFPSSTETFGNTITESMASGLTTVGFNYAAAAVLIEDKVNGLVSPTMKAEDFIKTAVESLGHYQNRELRRAAAESMVALSWRAIAKRFIEIAESVR